MPKPTLKELQKRCREAGLKTTGTKAALVERLDGFHSAHSILGQECTIQQMAKRIESLENSLVAMRSSRSSSSNGSVNEGIRPPHMFLPQQASSPREKQPTVTFAQPVVQPDAEGTAAIPNNNHPSLVTATVSTSSTNCNAVPVFSRAYVPPVSSTSWQPVYTHCQQWYPATSGEFIPSATQPYRSMAADAIPRCSYASPQGGSFGHINDIMAILPEFDPIKESSLSSSQFIQRVQILKNAYQWRDDLTIFGVQQKMKGHAKMWVDGQREVFVSWTQFAQSLLEAFPFESNPADAHINLASTKRLVGESPQEYYFKMVALGHKYGLQENAITRHIVNGINDEDLRKKISNDYSACVHLLRDIECYCRYNEVKGPIAKTKSVQSPSVAKNKVVNVERKIKCYNCAKFGHISTNCPEPKKERCKTCNKRNHLSKDCPSLRNKTSVNVINEKNDKNAELIKEVKINNRVYRAFVDSGSNRSLMRHSVANSIGNLASCNVKLKGFGGGTFESSKMVSTEIEIDGQMLTAKLIVVNDELIHEDLFLGRDLLCQKGQRVVIENQQCWVENIKVITSETSHLPVKQSEQLKKILADYRTCFAEKVQDLGTCTVAEMKIEVSSNAPVNVKPYRLPFAKRARAREIVEELLEAGIITRSESAYASPVVLVPKTDGDLRLCVDYRQLNRVTVKTPFPMPIMEEQFAKLAGNTFFTTLDLRMGYHQIKIEEESQKYTAFVTTEGHYQYTRMPFGLVNAPAVFQNVMNILAAKLPPGEMIVYLDDVIIPSKTVEEGLKRLVRCLAVLKDAGLTLRLDKCKFLRKTITYLGHIISEQGITPGEKAVEAVRNFQKPKTVTEIRRFLGLTGFFRKFIKNYAIISTPLTQLLHKTAIGNFVWGESQEGSFSKLKELLCEKPVLVLYDFSAMHEVHTDASKVGLAGVLLQSIDGKNWKAVFYYSRHCTDAESRYHAYELEVLAAVETLTRFRVYLLGKPFRLVTDCSAIAKARTQKELIPKIARWYLKLMEFDFEAVHRPGNKLIHVDALSRAPNEPGAEVEPSGFVYVVGIDDNDWLLTMQLQDEKLKRIVSALRGEVIDDQINQFKKEYVLKNSRLFRREDGLKFVVPKAVRWRVVRKCHDESGHFGVEKTMDRIKQYFWFPRMRKYVSEYISACIECCYAKVRGGKPEGQLHISEVEAVPFATLHIDHLGPFIKSARGMYYVLAISDAYTKFLIVKAVRNTKTGPVLNALYEVTTYFGLPKRIISDRGTAFTSKQFNDFCSQYDIQHIKTAVRTPRANGQVERANQTILSILRATEGKPNNWDLELRNVQWLVNSQKNATTGFSPNELVYDFNLRDVTHNKMVAVLHEEVEVGEAVPISEKRQQAEHNINTARARWKKRFDERHAKPTLFKAGDLVMIENVPTSSGESRKLEPRYKGPYVVNRALDNDRYLISDVPGMQVSQRRYEAVHASDKMKFWCDGCPELDGDDDAADSDTEDGTSAGLAELSCGT